MRASFQALVPVPYFHIGSELFGRLRNRDVLYWSMLYSYHNKLPIIANYASRTALEETKTLLSFLGPAKYSYKQRLKHILPSQKDFLVVSFQDTLSLFPDEAHYLAGSQLLRRVNEKVSLLRLTYSEAFTDYEFPFPDEKCFSQLKITSDNADSLTFSVERIKSYDLGCWIRLTSEFKKHLIPTWLLIPKAKYHFSKKYSDYELFRYPLFVSHDSVYFLSRVLPDTTGTHLLVFKGDALKFGLSLPEVCLE